MIPLNADTTGEQIASEYGANANGKTSTYPIQSTSRKRPTPGVHYTILTHTVLITGPSTGGLGSTFLLTLARHSTPAHILLLGRNLSKIEPVIKELAQINPAIKTTFIHIDLCDNASVEKAAAEVNELVEGIDVMVNNAGLGAGREYMVSKNGVEARFAANHLGHFLLTGLLAEKVGRVGGRVVSVGSMAYTLAEVDTEDINFEVRMHIYTPMNIRWFWVIE